MKLTDRQLLLDAAQHLDVMRQHLAQRDVDDQLVLDAAALRLSATIDSLSLVADELRNRAIDDTTWRAIKGMRNRIAHRYSFIDPAVLRSTLEHDVDTFEANVRDLLEQVPE